MFPSFVQSVLGTPRQHTRFAWIRSVIAVGMGFYAGHFIAGDLAVVIGFAAAALSFYTLAPVLALLICFVEQLLS